MSDAFSNLGDSGSEERGIALETGGGILKFYSPDLNGLIETMRMLGPKITARLVKGALKRAAEPMLHAARSLAPMETGFLMSQLMLVTMTSSRFKGSYSAAVTTSGKGLYKGDAFYAAFVELGHFSGRRVTKATKTTRRERNMNREFIPAQPFLRTAFDENVEVMSAAIESEIAAVFDQEWPKEAAKGPLTMPVGALNILRGAGPAKGDWMESAGIAPS